MKVRTYAIVIKRTVDAWDRLVGTYSYHYEIALCETTIGRSNENVGTLPYINRKLSTESALHLLLMPKEAGRKLEKPLLVQWLPNFVDEKACREIRTIVVLFDDTPAYHGGGKTAIQFFDVSTWVSIDQIRKKLARNNNRALKKVLEAAQPFIGPAFTTEPLRKPFFDPTNWRTEEYSREWDEDPDYVPF